ncbi:Cysteine and glycine-rich protein 2 [Habropoda laboriosa]|uniref:Cysteine and glycine-rich protein 2 n=1 Tax=Habropoda laboriosa TaxID=597456 RepID=A0A0L7QWY2_9HYME|nr:Cysteine and glycine-rich protein 2 [Habropoda laboriosa]
MPGVCPRCNREVYFAEEKLALGKVWHTFCFSCCNCRKLLNSCSVVTHLGELFCKNCYVRLSLSTTNHEIKATPHSSATLALSAWDSLNCYCCGAENTTGNASQNRNQHYPSGKCRLRGGGSEVEETNICFDEEKKYFLENECANLGIVNSMTTICDPPPSPTAVTTWYNRQHSKCRSTLTLESQKNNVVAKDCRFEAQEQENDQSEPKTSFSNNEVNITEAQLSTDQTRVTPINWNNKINEYDPAYEFSADNVIIPSRRKFAYPPVPPPRNPLPSRRRVSFYDVVFGDTRENDQNCITNMQDARRRPCYDNDNNKGYTKSYDIWQADDPVGKNDGGYENVNISYTEDSGRMHFERSASDYGEEDTLSKCNDIEKNHGQDRCVEGNTESRTYRIMNEKDDASSKEDTMTYGQQNGPNLSNELDDNERMRGGCGGPCGSRLRPPCGTIKLIETTCHCKREPDPCRAIVTSCTTCSSPCTDRRGCCPPANERPICKKPIIRCRAPCTGESQTCGGGGCCGSGCRGGCGKPGQTCLPARPCAVPPCRPCSPCSSPRPCSPQVICCCGGRKGGSCCGSGGSSACCCRSKSPICRASRTRRCCSTDRAELVDSVCCRPKSGCECLGGGLDCQRCGRKVYQAEMQIVSGMPFHNICFSCYCCRKPLESLTYQENCGEIYCKQCYVRNFGPQGYGYGVGPGALQTPM